jgi:hypothetical protein
MQEDVERAVFDLKAGCPFSAAWESQVSEFVPGVRRYLNRDSTTSPTIR